MFYIYIMKWSRSSNGFFETRDEAALIKILKGVSLVIDDY